MALAGIAGHLVLVMGPTGSGKGSLIAHALQALPEVAHTISCTTRARRPSEVDGVNYHFLSREQFEKKIAEGAFVEYAEFGGHLYGTLHEEFDAKLKHPQVVICEVDLQGVQVLMELVDRSHRTLVYIEAGDWDTLQRRALSRAPISHEELALRRERFLEEESFKENADVVICNDDAHAQDAKSRFVAFLEDTIAKLKTAT